MSGTIFLIFLGIAILIVGEGIGLNRYKVLDRNICYKYETPRLTVLDKWQGDVECVTYEDDE